MKNRLLTFCRVPLQRIERRPGLYIVRCKANGASYCGSTTSLSTRLRKHVSDMACGTHTRALMKQDWKRFGGADAFEYFVMYATLPKLQMKEVEDAAIVCVRGLEHAGGYNAALNKGRDITARIRDTETKLRRKSKFYYLPGIDAASRIPDKSIRIFCQSNRPLYEFISWQYNPLDWSIKLVETAAELA